MTDPLPQTATLPGRVVRIEGTRYWVDRADGEGEVPCRLPGRLKKSVRRSKQPVVVGDEVHFEVPADGDEEGVLDQVGPRHSKLSRRAAGRNTMEQIVVANVDQLAIVASLGVPPFRPGLIDRLLVAAGQGKLEPLICVNKIDLDPDGVEAAIALYVELGYRVVCCSAETGEGLEPLREALAGRVSVLAGHSGVGKSSLLNALQPGLEIRTGEVSEATSRGRHTTTTVSLLKLESGGFVVDTPGIRGFSIWDLDPADLDIFFPELCERLESCRYPNCSHVHEPRCAVKAAVEAGEIKPERFESYLAILESLLEDAPDYPTRRGGRR